MNMDMTMTSGMESTPSFDISTNVRRRKMDIRSGMLKTRRMNMQKRPNVAMELEIIINSMKEYRRKGTQKSAYGMELCSFILLNCHNWGEMGLCILPGQRLRPVRSCRPKRRFIQWTAFPAEPLKRGSMTDVNVSVSSFF